MTPSIESITSVARTLAPEDVRAGIDIAVLTETVELIPFCLVESPSGTPPLRRYELLATPIGVPLRVRAVCVPFVLVETPRGKRRTLDLRRTRVAELDEAYAREARRAFAPKRTSKRKRRR